MAGLIDRIRERIDSIQERMDRMADRMAAAQAKFFLNVFYILVVPFAHLYLRVTGNIHHEVTGYFQEREPQDTALDTHLKQH